MVDFRRSIAKREVTFFSGATAVKRSSKASKVAMSCTKTGTRRQYRRPCGETRPLPASTETKTLNRAPTSSGFSKATAYAAVRATAGVFDGSVNRLLVKGRPSFLEKRSKKLLTLGRVGGWALVYGEAQELMTFFWFFLFTKRTTWLWVWSPSPALGAKEAAEFACSGRVMFLYITL